ncbi:AraC family transcriptional regulator [Emticicia fluvialis]|uniref:AraC family transcriptional regulator n=1 Tax=Emticicia fluvialis TaxID=2974474 RepID=UPI002165D49E|nr:helix-turn-helix domain-containing protein [Emticicia fluvialis]
MPSLPTIRNLYMPVQPTVRQSADDVVYQEWAPHERLLPFVYCYWELKTVQPLQDAFVYRVVADGCIDIYFEINNPADAYVMGFCRQFTEFPLGNVFHYVGIRFLPAQFPQLFGVDAAGLSNRYLPLADVLPQMAGLMAALPPGMAGMETLRHRLDAYLLRHLAHFVPDFDNRLYGAIGLILQNCGVLNVEKDLDTGISARQLRRLFEFYVGDTPKTFARVVRFQHILRARPSSQSLHKNPLFFDTGYYDQAHFIKEFRNFYGVTPSRAFGR